VNAHEVIASEGGRRYHAYQHCRAYRNGRRLWAFKADEWVPGMSTTYLTSGRPLLVIDISEAAGRGLLPCGRCRPIRTTDEPEDFGHEPMTVEQFGSGRLHARFTACARCYPHAARWPCASAVLLGLTPTT
jgi:hypothetical protein